MTAEVEGPDVRKVVGDLAMAAWSLSSLGFALETGLVDAIGEPAPAGEVARRTDLPGPLVEAVLEVLVTMGLVRRESDGYAAEPGLARSLVGLPRELLRAEVMSNQLQALDFVERGRRRDVRLGWDHEDPEILQAQGTRSKVVVEAFATRVFPQLPGLLPALHGPHPTFLDVGSGVGEIAIAMCRRYPTLRAVALDPLEPAMALAEGNVRNAGLEDRIELRRGRVEDLAEDASFDAAQVPVLFLPDAVLAMALTRLRGALRPGGWVVLQVPGFPGVDLPPLFRLICLLWGSDGRPPDHAAGLLEAAGYEAVTMFPPLPGPPVSYAAGRNPGTLGATP